MRKAMDIHRLFFIFNIDLQLYEKTDIYVLFGFVSPACRGAGVECQSECCLRTDQQQR